VQAIYKKAIKKDNALIKALLTLHCIWLTNETQNRFGTDIMLSIDINKTMFDAMMQQKRRQIK